MTKAAEIFARWNNAQVPAIKSENGVEWARGDFFGQAMEDIIELCAECERLSKSKTNAERKARKAKKKIQGSPGDTSVQGVAEQALLGTTGAKARSAAKKETEQSQSVSESLAPANEAGNSGVVGLTSGTPGPGGYANGSPGVEGRQSLHPTTTSGSPRPKAATS